MGCSVFQKVERQRKNYFTRNKNTKIYNKKCTSIMNKSYYLFQNAQQNVKTVF